MLRQYARYYLDGNGILATGRRSVEQCPLKIALQCNQCYFGLGENFYVATDTFHFATETETVTIPEIYHIL